MIVQEVVLVYCVNNKLYFLARESTVYAFIMVFSIIVIRGDSGFWGMIGSYKFQHTPDDGT